MAISDKRYVYIVAESFEPVEPGTSTKLIHIRPVPGQSFPPSLRVEGRKELAQDYPVGTKFRIKVKLTDRLGKRPYLYTSWQWPIEVVALGSNSNKGHGNADRMSGSIRGTPKDVDVSADNQARP